MVLLQQETIFTTCIFQNANLKLNPKKCDLLFSYDGHDIFLEQDNKKIKHEPLKVLEIYTQIIIPMSNNFSTIINNNDFNTYGNNPYILQNGVVIEWSITRNGEKDAPYFFCIFDVGVNGNKAGFKVMLQVIDNETPYLLYSLFLRMFEFSRKNDNLISKQRKQKLESLIKQYKSIRNKAKIEKNRICSTVSALKELKNLKLQVNIIMEEALNCPFDNSKQSKLLDLRNKIMRLGNILDFESDIIKDIIDDTSSFLPFLLETTIFNRRFLKREYKNNIFDDWYR
jgi:hypothetical protein